MSQYDMRFRSPAVRTLERIVVTANSPKWYHSNSYNAAAACPSCGGIIRHETWCSATNNVVRYTFDIARHPEDVEQEDVLRLHALGVTWT